MDNVLVNFQSGIDRLTPELIEKHKEDLDKVLGIISLMYPLKAAIEYYQKISQNFDTYILSSSLGRIQHPIR